MIGPLDVTPDLDAVAAYDYVLPPALIAQRPAVRRDASRLLHVPPGGAPEHHGFAALPALLRPGDLVVCNDTRVWPARLRGRRRPGGGRVELLLVEPDPQHATPGAWRCLGRPGRHLVPGACVDLAGGATAHVHARLGGGLVRVSLAGADGTALDDAGVFALCTQSGEVPLPPYIDPAACGEGATFHRDRYQTVFARDPGAVAAPTAGLHFTPDLLATLAARGVAVAPVTLHVGPDTFLPVRGERLSGHHLQGERFVVPPATAAAIANARRAGGRVVAVGTTTTRALETTGGAAGAGTTTLFLRPGHPFRAVDALLTNFHLPRSTLLALVCAFGGHARVLAAYDLAVTAGYRFYSYGDAMLLWPAR